MKIIILSENYEDKYEAFTSKANKRTLFYCSNKYRRLLKEYLNCRDLYLLALNEENEIIGVLPTFLKENQEYGNVLNSLPFYGSNGGIISNNYNVKIELIKAFENLSEKYQCVSSTIITAPLDTIEEKSFYKKNTTYNFIDERIGQITSLPHLEDNYEEILKDSFHTMVNRCIKKAKSNDFTVELSNDQYGIEFLYKTHKDNIESIGGLAKDQSFFNLIPKFFKPEEDYNIYIAKLNGKMAAALLLFYFNKTVEYFTPAINNEYRSKQPLSLLIYKSMLESIIKGYSRWNWGGTWLTQSGVYDFKRKWGTTDHKYYYFINLKKDELKNLSKEVLLKQYKGFYVLPFSELNNI